MIPQRKPTTTPPCDEAQLVEMGLSPVPKQPITIPVKQSPSQAKEQSVSELLAEAFKKSSQCPISKDESDALMADFPDADFVRGAGGDNNLVYLEHGALRQRFNKVLGLGQWSITSIRSWSEEFKTAKGVEGFHVYCEVALLVRGCVVGSAVGKMDYFKNNPSQTYDDAHEGSKTAAFRRAAKEFGVGLQAYSKDWAEQWKAKYSGFNRPTR
jgi:hypothetical protein